MKRGDEMAKRYTVTYERDEDAMWTAVLKLAAHESCIASGRSIGEARKRIRGALAFHWDDKAAADAAVLVDDVKLPGSAKTAVSLALQAREEAQRQLNASLSASSTAAELLTQAGLSRRDAAELLGMSYQRIQQFAEAQVVRRASRAATPEARRAAGKVTATRKAARGRTSAR